MSTPRSLGLHERYSVARRSVQSSSTVAAAALLRLSASAPDHSADVAFDALAAQLARRIQRILVVYPLLAHCVKSSRSRTPTWARIEPPPTAADILHIGEPLALQPNDAHATATLLGQALLQQQIALPKCTQLEAGPLWQVKLHRVDDAAGPACLVVLATEHAINDGRGTINLFRLLLQAHDDKENDEVVEEAWPVASDGVFDLKPSVRYMLGMVWQELVLPKLPLPRRLAKKLRGPVSWPQAPLTSDGVKTKQIVRSPKDCAPMLDVVLIAAPQLISNLKRLAQAHVDPHTPQPRPATLHAVVHTLGLAALYAALAKSHAGRAELERFEVVLGSATPISLRHEASTRRTVRLPETSGNYVSSYTCSNAVCGAASFWTAANRFSTRLASPAGRRKAKFHMGLLAYIPDFETELDAAAQEKGSYANGWEKFFGEKTHASDPFDSAFTVSNLGMLDTAQLGPQLQAARWEVESATWAQSHTPQGEAFGVDVIGYSAGKDQCISIAISSRPACFADPNLHARFTAYFDFLVRAFALTPTDAGEKLDRTHTLDPNPSFAHIARTLHTALPHA